ncbi:MAG: glycosyltransferase [Chitinivibrionales bacterium]|nr:glycosyltransferase [Chitinivibrionales bacterium]
MDTKVGIKPHISLIIAVYQRPDFLEKILASLRNQSFASFEIIVADDGSGPEIASVIRNNQNRFCHPIIHVRHDHDGFRKTVIINRAVTKASADYLVFIDGDCLLHHLFLQYHFKRKKPKNVLAGRRVMLSEKVSKEVSVDMVANRQIEKLRYFLRDCLHHSCKHGFLIPGMFHIRNVFKRHYHLVGSNFSVYREDFLAINGYDERIIGRGLEDNNLEARFVLAGMRLNSIVFEALQYHLFHHSDPIPHSPETIEQFCTPSHAWTEFGIQKR